jgi:hypothetical protein
MAYAIGHGGAVTKRYRYGYPGDTQWVFSAALSHFDSAQDRIETAVMIRAGNISSYKVTHCGCAARAGYRELYDQRVGGARRDAAIRELKSDLLHIQKNQELVPELVLKNS